jgi:hypothetical protein
VTITDVPEKSDKTVFMRIAGKGRDGKTIALNAEHPIEILDEKCFDQVASGGNGKGLRGYSICQWGVLMGIWNVRENGGLVEDEVSIEDVVGSSLKMKNVIGWSHARQEVFLSQGDPSKNIVLRELDFDILSFVEMKEEAVCFGLIDKYNSFAAIDSREGNIWKFKCLGEAVWVVQGHPRVNISVEGTVLTSIRWQIGDLTVVRASLTDYSTTSNVVDRLWWVQLIIESAT